MLVNDTKVILGRVKNGKWVETSKRLTINKIKKTIKIARKITSRPGGKIKEVGLKYGPQGLIEKESRILDVESLKDESLMGMGMYQQRLGRYSKTLNVTKKIIKIRERKKD